jgi:hypothetical protein
MGVLRAPKRNVATARLIASEYVMIAPVCVIVVHVCIKFVIHSVNLDN